MQAPLCQVADAIVSKSGRRHTSLLDSSQNSRRKDLLCLHVENFVLRPIHSEHQVRISQGDAQQNVMIVKPYFPKDMLYVFVRSSFIQNLQFVL